MTFQAIFASLLLLGLTSSAMAQQSKYADEAIAFAEATDRDVKPMRIHLSKIQNEFQLEVIKDFLQYKTSENEDYNIVNKFPYILSINNSYQVEAIRYMLADQRDINPSMQYLVQITSPFQVEMIKELVQGRKNDGSRYPISERFPAILDVDTSNAVEAVKIMLQYKRDIQPSFQYLVQVKTPEQVLAVKLLAQGKTYQGDDYKVFEQMPYVLEFNNSLQVEALRALISGGVGINLSMALLPQIKTQEQVDLIKRFARYKTMNTSISFAFLNPTPLQMRFLERLLEGEAGADVFHSAVKKLDSVKTEIQLHLLDEIIVKGKKLPVDLNSVLKIENEHQLDFARFLISKKLSLDTNFPQILRVQTERQAESLKTEINKKKMRVWIARRIKKSLPPLPPKQFDRIFSCISDLEEDEE